MPSQHCRLGRLRASKWPLLVKVGFLGQCGFLGERLPLGEFEHVRNASNPWRVAHALPIIRAAYWERGCLLICTLVGLTEERATTIGLALERG